MWSLIKKLESINCSAKIIKLTIRKYIVNLHTIPTFQKVMVGIFDTNFIPSI